MAAVVIDYGERRHIKLLIRSCKNEDFMLLNVQYEFVSSDGKIEDYGLANVIEHIIDIVVEPQKKGSYTLKITYQIADEVLVESVLIKVI